MTDQMWDSCIRDALLETTAEEFAEVIDDTTPVQISRRYRREMEKMLRDPAAWVRRKSRPRRRMALKIAAAFVLVCGILFSCAMAASPSVRAKVVQWAREVYETMVVYRFSGEPTEEELPRYVIGDLPEGYSFSGEVVRNADYVKIAYVNTKSEMLYLTYSRMEQGGMYFIKGSEMEKRKVEVGDYTGEIYLSLTGETSNGVIWLDDEKGIYFTVDGFLDEAVLLHIAESVILEDSTNS